VAQVQFTSVKFYCSTSLSDTDEVQEHFHSLSKLEM